MILLEKTLDILATLVRQIWRYPLVGLLLMVAVLAPAAWSAPIPPDKVIAVCDDGEEWPPYTYYKRSLGIKTDELVGYAQDQARHPLAGRSQAKATVRRARLQLRALRPCRQR